MNIEKRVLHFVLITFCFFVYLSCLLEIYQNEQMHLLSQFRCWSFWFSFKLRLGWFVNKKSC